MRQAWRWFGPNDPVTLDHVRQAGATEIVSALHHLPPGTVWTQAEVEAYRDRIETTPPGRTKLTWSIVESIPVADEIKRHGTEGPGRAATEVWIESLRAVAAAGIRTVCYNFMPVLDWTRTDLEYELPTGATALRFDQARFAAFDLFILRRAGAEAEYDDAIRARAKALADGFTQDQADSLTRTIAAGLPGTTTDSLDLDGFRAKLEAYRGIDAAKARAHLIAFLAAVTPVAEKLGVRLTLHPDDPPRPLFGLPRIASTEADYAALFAAVPSPSNGICFCTGSLGVRADNDLPGMAERFAPRIHFAHLRATKRDPDGSFHEADHLDGDVDMVGVAAAMVREERRRAADPSRGEQIPFRPDHGHRMLGDLEATRRVNPGYTGVGRLKGLAELRGVIRALERVG